MTGYETIKLARKTGATITLAMLDTAVEEQKALVSALAIEAGVVSGTRAAEVKLSPFPIEAGEPIEVMIGRAVEAMRHLSKLTYFRAKVAGGGEIGQKIDGVGGSPDAGE